MAAASRIVGLCVHGDGNGEQYAGGVLGGAVFDTEPRIAPPSQDRLRSFCSNHHVCSHGWLIICRSPPAPVQSPLGALLLELDYEFDYELDRRDHLHVLS